jgi:hypothetical protein
MNIQTKTKKLIAIEFTIDDGDDIYPGAIVMKQEEYDALLPGALEQLQLQKYNEWRASRVRPTVQEETAAKQKELDSLQQIREELATREVQLKTDLGIE